MKYDQIHSIDSSTGLQNQLENSLNSSYPLIGELVGDLLCLVAAILYAAPLLNRAGTHRSPLTWGKF